MFKQSNWTFQRIFSFCLFLTIGLVLAQSTARADVVTIQGFTRGCFNCVFPQPRSSPVSHLGLTFHGSTFEVTTTAAGNASLGTAPLGPGNFNNFGSFTLLTEPHLYNGTFVFDVVFTTYNVGFIVTASVTGEVTSDGAGNLFINFGNNPMTFASPNGIMFQFRLNDVSITPGGSVSLTGDILNATNPVPEPATMILLGTGLVGVAARARRRRRDKLGESDEPQTN